MYRKISSLLPGVGAVLLLSVGVCMGGVTLIAPEVEVREGDRLVDLLWRDPEPGSLVAVDSPVLGSISFPWGGGAVLISEGFYLGACDWPYGFLVSLVGDSIELSWQEIIDWRELTSRPRRVVVPDVEHFLELSHGLRVKVDSTGLFITDTTAVGWNWNGPLPAFHGIYVGGAPLLGDSSVVYTITCTSGGSVTESAGDADFEWVSDLGSDGSFKVTRADSSIEVEQGLRVRFPAGTYVAQEAFLIEALVPLVNGNRFTIAASTFEGYLALRKSVEDRIDHYKVRANISKCDTFEFFEDGDGNYDPWGDRSYIDRGVVSDQPGVTPDPDLKTVLDGFPYRYAVVTWDWSESHEQVLSEIDWDLVDPVYPSVAPDSTGVGRVTVVPNPYILGAGWEVDDSRLLFMNVPADASIRIYDATGGYVDTVQPNSYSYDESKKQGSAEWNLRNADGRAISSGIYIYHVESKLGEKVGRFIVVR